MIRLTSVDKTYRQAGREVHAIRRLDFHVAAGEYLCILGRSGCGKSTTFKLLLGLERPSRGRVEVLGFDPAADFARLRGRIACVFQDDRLLPWRTARDNVALPLQLAGHGDAISVAEHWLQRLGLRGFEAAYPYALSGGMRQRAAIARALASNPEILLADEAFGHLDAVTGGALRDDFRSLARERGTTVVHVTHSIDEAIGNADRIHVLGRPGHVVAEFTGIAGGSAASLRRAIIDALGDSGAAPVAAIA
jgi:NitT/TauT family transport system ATP-binding protein